MVSESCVCQQYSDGSRLSTMRLTCSQQVQETVGDKKSISNLFSISDEHGYNGGREEAEN